MADITAEIETMEHRFMRAWAKGDVPALKGMTARNFHLLVGSKPAVMLDRASWLEACTTRLSCSAYRFGDIYVREVGGMALFASQLEIEGRIDASGWPGRLWVTDLWRKGRVRRQWKLVERVLSRVEEDQQVPQAIRAMQLWR